MEITFMFLPFFHSSILLRVSAKLYPKRRRTCLGGALFCEDGYVSAKCYFAKPDMSRRSVILRRRICLGEALFCEDGYVSAKRYFAKTEVLVLVRRRVTTKQNYYYLAIANLKWTYYLLKLVCLVWSWGITVLQYFL